MHTTIQSGTRSSTLHLELHGLKILEESGITPLIVARQVERMGWLVGLAGAIATNHLVDAPPDRRAKKWEPELVRAHYGSPLEGILAISAELGGHLAAMAFLIYGVKRLWGIDLELKTHREELRKRYFEASEKAELARWKAEKAIGQGRRGEVALSRRARRELGRLDREQGWGKGASADVERMKEAPRNWIGDEAVWFFDD